ncbi:MAG: hypothetical protein RMJ97_04520 [Raineya sp.]|nr:hypothetical protein [Raineya sp.]
MRERFFKTLRIFALVSGGSIALFTALVLIFYKSPLNSLPMGFSWIFFIAFPAWAMLYYKLKVNGGFLQFQEGLVMGALVSFAMFIAFASAIAIGYAISENILLSYKNEWLKELTENKEIWLKRLKTAQDFEKLYKSYQYLTIGEYLFREFGAKSIILLLVSVVGATAFRSGDSKKKKAK